jgi:hypothetical protein
MSLSAEQTEPLNSIAQTSAAKLHVLRLGPIKERLGPRWLKLSDLVHKLFETALRDVQGPQDHFILLDELSYVVTFHGLSVEEASFACTAVAQKVCERLFGSTGAGIAVRALVGRLSNEVLAGAFKDGQHIANYLELNGREIVVSSNAGGIPPSTITVRPGAGDGAWVPTDTIAKTRELLLPLGLEIGLFPVWELARGKCSSLSVSPYWRNTVPKISCMRQLPLHAGDRVAEAEITLLVAAHAYAHRVHQERKVCALGAAVSFETLASFHSRIRYITALKSLHIPPECPILLKIEDIAAGTPLSKVAELISMLAVPHVRFLIQFCAPHAIPDMVDIRLGASGMGFVLPPNCDSTLALTFMKKLVHAFSEKKGFVFVEGLDTHELVRAALSCGVRFGTGQAVDQSCFSGQESVPSFPLSRHWEWAPTVPGILASNAINGALKPSPESR